MSPTPAAPRPVEVELKYRLREEAAGDRYLVAEELAGFKPISPVRSTQLEDRYLDTADGALARAGFAARLRQTARGTTVSIKSTSRRSGDSGIHRREELEGPADRTAGPRDWPPSDARSLILEQCGDAPLVELVTIRQLRRKRKLQSDDTIVELSLDEVDAVARSRVVERFVELEVELMEGDEEALGAIDAILAADRGLTASTGSKLESALNALRATSGRRGKRSPIVLPEIDSDADGDEPTSAVATGEEASTEAAVAPAPPAVPAAPPVEVLDVKPPEDRPAPSVAAKGAAAAPSGTVEAARHAPDLAVGKTPGVLADDHIAEAGRKVLRFHLARMIAREEGTRDGGDPEDLHAMRVATRRQRAAWRVFGEAFRAGRTRVHRKHLREVASRLGAVRDLDVLLDAADAYRAPLAAAEQRALEPLLAGWRTHRDDARRLLLRE
ncbi:MAG TPA: CHAD domain-containing protein, partial [Candidatus Limnocylindrales bacterium]|nr:CHAD domain-containing protein [Candidatus Limnocylindrales bacterium]